jgi:hypothetical protein
MTKFRAPRSMPASEVSRLSRKINVVIAGNELRFNPCNFSIIFPAKLNERKQYSDDNTGGISLNKLFDKSREIKLGARDDHAGAVSVCSEQSIRLRYLRHCHFSSGSCCWAFEAEEEKEELEMTLLLRLRKPARGPREEELLRELDGRGEEDRWGVGWGREGWCSVGTDWEGLVGGRGGDVAFEKRGSPLYVGEWTCRELRLRRLSVSSRTRSIISSAGSLMFPLRTMRERKVSESTCQP